MKKKLALAIILGISIFLSILYGTKLNQAYSPLPTVYYDGQKRAFTYLNVNHKDLLPSFKEIMPGDVKEQKILLKFGKIKRKTKIFLNVNKDTNSDVLQYMKLYIDDKEISFNDEYILLGTFTKEAQSTLKVVFALPKEVGNEIANVNKAFQWNMLVQEENGELLEVPQTYDDSNIIIYFIIFALSLVAILYSIAVLIHHKEKNKIEAGN